MEMAKNAIGDAEKQISFKLLPIAAKLATAALPLVISAIGHLSDGVINLIDWVGNLYNQFRGPIMSVFALVRDSFLTFA